MERLVGVDTPSFSKSTWVRSKQHGDRLRACYFLDLRGALSKASDLNEGFERGDWKPVSSAPIVNVWTGVRSNRADGGSV